MRTMKAMERKRSKWVYALVLLICVMVLVRPVTVHATVETDVNAQETTADIVVVEETTGTTVDETAETEGAVTSETAAASETSESEAAAETDAGAETESTMETSADDTGDDTAFSVSGNGELLDDITDDETKEFITVTTANGNTYFLIIDRSSSSENVYLLSMIDEYDLQDFIEEEQADSNTTSSEASVVLDETTVETDTDSISSGTEENGSGGIGANGVMLLLIVLVAGGGGAYFYFKVYRPKQEQGSAESEGMEYDGEIPTEKDDDEDEDDEE